MQMNNDTNFIIKAVFDAAKLINGPIPLHDKLFVMEKDAVGDLVTNFDFIIERFLIDKLKTRYKKFDIISEEFNPTNELTRNCFTIDPLDGTINFAHGLPLWGIQVAMIKNGITYTSVIYLPKLGELFYADETGAYMIDNPTKGRLKKEYAKKISVSKKPLNKTLYLVEGGMKFPALYRMAEHSRHFRYYCCTAVNNAWTACGRLGGNILRKDYIWDYLPGQFLVEKAGGVIINKKGIHVSANNKELANLLLTKGKLKTDDK
jgi:myo-inositol-1(or 4)-monophosphatase